ncbi:MAG TPA: hypothetical protein VD766_10290 [Solirubrobacterales bacterium]|nr:hypothetical protein [Solirubrobacterales bacterium]
MGDRAYAHIRANLAGYVALFLLFTTGTAKAVDGPLAGQNTVGSEDIIDGEVRSLEIAPGGIASADIGSNTLLREKFVAGTLRGDDVSSDGLGGSDIDESTFFNDNTLTGGDLDEATLFNDNSLNSGDLGVNSVGASEISANSVTSSDVSDGSMTSADIGTDQIRSSEIASSAIRSNELGPIEIVRTSRTLEPGEDDVLNANCPTGSTGLGGDALMVARFDNEDGPRLVGSFPRRPSGGSTIIGWTGIFRNDHELDGTAFVFAYCLP